MRVSIYMPTKNRLASLQLAVNSVLTQSYSDIELLVVDDGSTDGSREYLLQLQDLDSRVKVFLNDKSRGACYARNVAIKAATGEFVTGLDDDDEYLPQHIGALVEYWQLLAQYGDEPVSCLYTHIIARRPEGFIRVRRRPFVEFYDLFESNCIGNQIFAPRSHFIDVGLFDEQMPAWQDMELFFRIMKKFGKARLLDLHTYLFDEMPRDDRISSGRKDRIVEAYNRMSSKHADSRQARQRLLLQVHAHHYNFPIKLVEIFNFMKLGFWFYGYKEILTRYWQRKFLEKNKK